MLDVELADDLSTEVSRIKRRRGIFLGYSLLFTGLNIAYTAFTFTQYGHFDNINSVGSIEASYLKDRLEIAEYGSVVFAIMWYVLRVRKALGKVNLAGALRYKFYTRLTLVGAFLSVALIARVVVNAVIISGVPVRQGVTGIYYEVQTFFYFTFLEALPTWVISSTLGQVSFRLKVEIRHSSDYGGLTTLSVASDG